MDVLDEGIIYREFAVIESSVRLMNILNDNQIKTVDEAMAIPKWKYYSWRNMGKKSMIELEEILNRYPEFPTSVFNVSFTSPSPREDELLALMRKYEQAMHEREMAAIRMSEVEASMKGKMEHLFAAYAQLVSSVESGAK